MFDHERLAELIREKGVEQKSIAVKVGVSETMMSFLVNGLKDPSLTVLSRLARELGVPVSELIKEEAEAK